MDSKVVRKTRAIEPVFQKLTLEKNLGSDVTNLDNFVGGLMTLVRFIIILCEAYFRSNGLRFSH